MRDGCAFPAPTDDGAANHLVAGYQLPSVALPSTSGDVVDLAKRTGRSIVFFYPWTGAPGRPNPPGWDDIPGAHGSTPEAQGFAHVYADFQALGYEVFGVSGQTGDDQLEFSRANTLPFQLLSDHGFRLQKAAFLPTFATGGHVFLSRLTLLLNDGRIEKVFYPVYPPDTHAAHVLDDVSLAGRDGST